MRPDYVFVLVAALAVQDADSTRSARDGIYTDAQARRGEAVFRATCSLCHQPDYFTTTFLRSWSGAPLDLLFDVVSTTMPEDRPGGLTPQQYADVLAYIFELNGLPPGRHELPAAPEQLARIILERSDR